MIYTCTLNPSVDYIVQVDELRIGELNRAMKTATFPGGKGINVSRVLKRLNVDNTALGFIGGFTGAFIEQQLRQEHIQFDFVKVPGDTRINIKLKDGKETEINGQGPAILPEHEEALMQKISALSEDDILVLAGSIPSSLSADVYHRMMDKAKKANVKVVVDTSGPALKRLITNQPFFVKPNHKELSELFDTSFYSKEDVIVCGRRLIELGAENVIVSMAGNGAFFFNKEMTLFAEAPKGTVKNSVGAGDSMVAGFLAAYTSGKSLETAFAYSVATGSATAFSEDLCTKEKVEQLVSEVKVTHL
ncbi:1-phosphofructokinase [Thermaerobacillus caldiproteolyticus]|uniref:Tagatose-6-phosphate kinase n=1 Tax=Thermaerobacillus caldiproteolyticus TaxID=247480 RepID=A0A7V9Z8D6_9BACL|nr:1-phosphofructokinase [Anoxybacillus caldiproteolyticus]MBA2875945.1 1-phosphofructokinase [Anoxybacillus caldiproteolyticus]